jgi:glycosidase
MISCKQEVKQTKTDQQEQIKPITDEILESAVIYEANIRQYSPEGSFNAFTKDIPKLKEMGVKILWVMPIFPISHTKRKATGGKFASEIKDPKEREKYLGSYYAVTDFRKINPEFGNIDDFRNLVKTAHENGIYVVIDWVPNHTGWDHVWIKDHPGFYTKNAKGEITEPLKEDGTPVGWADVADLNYDNKDLRKTMIADMKYWLENENIDGFRCDVAGSVPTDFWEEAIPELRKEKNIFMLAEAWEPELMKDHLFDMAYGWDTHHIMNAIAKGEKDVKAWDDRMNQIDTLYEKDDLLMNFTSNHDENSWNGTVFERMGDAAGVFAALTYTTPGMPLIYSGQEYGMDKRLLFFEKDTIIKKKSKFFGLYKDLGKLKNECVALNGGKDAADYIRIKTSDDKNILAFKREKNGKKLWFIANLNKHSTEFTLPLEGTFKDAFTGKEVLFKNGQKLTFKPWEYRILTK